MIWTIKGRENASESVNNGGERGKKKKEGGSRPLHTPRLEFPKVNRGKCKS